MTAITVVADDVRGEEDLNGWENPLPGRYHVKVEEVDDTFRDADSLVVVFDILAGTTPGQEGKQFKEFIGVQGKAAKRSLRFARAIDLIQSADLGKPARIDFKRAEGRQLVVDVEPHKYTNRKGKDVDTVRVEFMGFHSVFSQAVESVPKDKDALKLVKRPAGAVDGRSSSSGKSETPSEPTSLDDL